MDKKSKEFKSAIKTSQQRLPMTWWLPWYIIPHTHTHELISVLFKLGQKVERILPNLFYRPENKARQGNYKKRKIQAYIPDKYRYKNSQQDSSKPNTAAI